MKRICAWCKKELEGGPLSSKKDTPISHGMCPECAFHIRASMGMPLQEFLNGLNAPVVLVNGDGRVISANNDAQSLLGKSIERINGFKGGEVFECEYSYLPEGCGNTVHCAGCTIRNMVMDTMKTKKSHVRESAYLNHKTNGRIEFLISTEKVDEFAFLRIDEIRQ